MTRNVINDTDPGIDDVLALLLAFSATDEELEIVLISVTYGNISLADCLCNTILLLSRIRAEIQWRQKHGHDSGFNALRASRPTLATSTGASLLQENKLAPVFEQTSQDQHDYRSPNGTTNTTGTKALSDLDASHPDGRQISDTVQSAYNQFYHSDPATIFEDIEKLRNPDALFDITQTPAHEEILRLLLEHERDTIAIIALGPLTNIALAMAKDPATFSRAKELIVMGGNLATTNEADTKYLDRHSNSKSMISARSICVPVQATVPSTSIEPPFRLTTQPQGIIRNALNIRNRASPKAEYNTFADPLAAAYVYNSTSYSMPTKGLQGPGTAENQNEDHHSELPTPTVLTLFTHDVTVSHILTQDIFQDFVRLLVAEGSPLAVWLQDTLTPSFEKPTSGRKLSLNDALCIMYCLAGDEAFYGRSDWQVVVDQDIKVNVTGKWTKGATVLQDKNVKILVSGDVTSSKAHDSVSSNRLRQCIGIPNEDGAGKFLLSRMFGQFA